MNNADNHTNSWSDADIRKYLQGELSAREMHELEKAALDDPFLSDALEGLITRPHPEGDLDDLHARIAARVENQVEKQNQRPGLLWFRNPAFRVAAAIVLLAGLCFTAYYLLLDKKDRNVATSVAKENTTPATENKTPSPGSTTATPPLAVTQQQPATNPATQQQPAAKATQQPPATADTAFSAGLVAAESQPQANHLLKKASPRESASTAYTEPTSKASADKATAGKEATDSQSGYVDAAINAPAQARFTRDSIAPLPADTARVSPTPSRMNDLQNEAFSPSLAYKKYTPLPLRFSGRVVDANYRPLAGAYLNLNGFSNFTTTTDNHGQFNFRVQPRDTSQLMTVSMVGYQPASFSLNTNALTNNVIVLHEAKTNLDEVVVTGYGAKRRETLVAAPSDSDDRLDSAWLKVFPVIGRLAYEQYLATAKKTLSVDSTIRGTERISFQVDQKGKLTEFKIEQSLSPAHDAGLIQLISGGPAWRLLKGKKARAIVSLSFP